MKQLGWQAAVAAPLRRARDNCRTASDPPHLLQISLLAPAAAPSRDFRLEGFRRDPRARRPPPWRDRNTARLVCGTEPQGHNFRAAQDELLGGGSFWRPEGAASRSAISVREKRASPALNNASSKRSSTMLGVKLKTAQRRQQRRAVCARCKHGFFRIWPRNEGVEAGLSGILMKS